MYLLEFDEEKTMTYADFRSQAIIVPQIDQEMIENQFWTEMLERRMIPIYSIDNMKSLYPVDWKYWGIHSLTRNQSILHQSVASPYPGLNTPYLNFGMRFTSFGMHHEDSNLASLNVLHGGYQKVWYGVPSLSTLKLERLVNGAKPRYIMCDNFIRHKSILVPPSILEKNGIPFSKVVCFFNLICICLCV